MRVIERAIDILQCFDETNAKLTLHEIVERTGMHKATAFRIMSTLVDERILDQPTSGGSYELGFFALECADALLGASALRHKAVPIMVQLRDELNETVVLAQRRGNHILNLDKVVCRQGIIEAPIIGVWTLLHESPAGLAVLSTFGEQELKSYLTDVGARHRLPPALRNQIGNAKAAIIDPARTTAQSAVAAAPIIDRTGEAIAALSIAIPSGRMERGLAERCQRKLIWASQQLRA